MDTATPATALPAPINVAPDAPAPDGSAPDAPTTPATAPGPAPVTVIVEGQSFPVDAALAADQARLLAALRPFFPQLGATPVLDRQTDPQTGAPIIRVIKQAGQKGADAPAVAFAAALRAAPATLHPALDAAWRLYTLERAGGLDLATHLRLVPAIEAADDAGEAAARYATTVASRLAAAPPVPAPAVPAGF